MEIQALTLLALLALLALFRRETLPPLRFSRTYCGYGLNCSQLLLGFSADYKRLTH